MRGALLGLAVMAFCFACLCGVLFLMQRSLLYFPVGRSSNDAKMLTLQAGENRVLVSTRPNSGPEALIYFGGNAEDVSWNLPYLARTFPASALYVMHYRGYGGISGKPSEEALFADAIALYDAARALHPEITLIGRSLGSGVAIYLASVRPVKRLVVVTPYDSMALVAAAHFPYVPVRWLMRDRYESWKFAPQVTAPVTIVAAEHDEVIPRANTDALRARFRDGQVRYAVVRGADHNSISASGEYWELLKAAP